MAVTSRNEKLLEPFLAESCWVGLPVAGWRQCETLTSARDTALQPLSTLQWREECCEASGVVCLGKPQVNREVACLNTHTHTLLLQSYFCKNDEQTKAKASTNWRTNSVRQSMLNIMWYPFKSCLELKYSVGSFFSLPTENVAYCYLNSIYFCNSLLMQSCFSLGPWIYANGNEEKSWSRKEAQ